MVDIGSLRKAALAFDARAGNLRSFALPGFDGLYVMSNARFRLYDWIRLNHLLANLGYCAVFVLEIERLALLAENLDLAQEFYLDFEQTPQSVFTAEPASNSIGQESLLRDKLKAALANLNLQNAVATAGYATAMNFLAGDNSVISSEAFEQAALKLDQLASLELVPALALLRAKHRVPNVHDYEVAAAELELSTWLHLRADEAIESESEAESEPEPESTEEYARAVRAVKAQEYIDRAQHLLLVPVATTSQVPAYFHMGGINDMPPPHVHLALFQRWQRHKVQVLGFSPDALALYVKKPASTKELAFNLAIEHFRYCPDNVMRNLGTIGRLADEIKGCDLWQFSWE